MSTRKRLLAAAFGTAALAAVLIFCYFYFMQGTGNRSSLSVSGNEGEKLALVANDPFIDKMVGSFKKYYSETISDRSTQAGLLNIRDYIVATHAKNGRAVFYTILKRAFPDYANQTMDTLARLDQYNRWLEENRELLTRMNEAQRTAALWEKRRELFGSDAEKIWAGDMLATEARKAKMQDALAILDKSDDTSIEEKFQVYLSALRDTYKGAPEAFILDQPYLLSKVFFSIESVQDELKKMTPEQRQQEINSIRAQMGLPEEQVEKMAARDARNELRWQNGYQYMEKRDEIVKQYSGQEQEEKLKALREQYFQAEANTIEREEKDNFFRFERPRIYGRN